MTSRITTSPSIRSLGGTVGLALAMASALAGCFGGDDIDASPRAPAVTAEVPASASATPTDFIAYLKLLVAANADTLEPVSVDNLTPPTSDTTEPEPVT